MTEKIKIAAAMTMNRASDVSRIKVGEVTSKKTTSITPAPASIHLVQILLLEALSRLHPACGV